MDSNKYKNILLVVMAALLFFAGYKLFSPASWELPFVLRSELEELTKANTSLKDSLITLGNQRDTLVFYSEKAYKEWQSAKHNYSTIKNKYDQARNNTSTMSFDARFRVLSEWLENQ